MDNTSTRPDGDCVALIVAAGRGSRIGGEIPKQYRSVGGLPILRRSVLAFATHPDVDRVAVVIHPDDAPHYADAVDGLDLLPPVHGGATRQESVRRGLMSLKDQPPTTVLIHDAARPFIDPETIARTIATLGEKPGALVAVPVVDTLKRAGQDDAVSETVSRDGLWRAQTPQGFHYDAILAAHDAFASEALTDDASVAERAGLAVHLVEGRESNFKVTTEDDLKRAERHLSSGLGVRTGMGFDVHAFGPGDHVWLCGVKIAHDQGLIGHSDADVGLHAITDALLGAIGAGDIGAHFPPSDPQWKGAPSDVFLSHARDLVLAHGGTIANVDLTLICEAPRLRPHNEAMVARVAEILTVASSRVSVKATTTETLGFTGRGEGIAAQAVATIRMPD